MTATIKLPRMLWETVNTEPVHDVEGATVAETLDDLFARVPGLRGHIVEETGAVRPHVSIFVDGVQSDLDTRVGDGSDLRILHAVSGG
jgi:molybdopterin converting factor small subunit